MYLYLDVSIITSLIGLTDTEIQEIVRFMSGMLYHLTIILFDLTAVVIFYFSLCQT